MSTELDKIRPGTGLATRTVGTAELLDAWFRGHKESTRVAYERDLDTFVSWAGANDAQDAVDALIRDGNGPANLSAHAWRADMLEAGLAPSTVNRRLSALRSVVNMANRIGIIEWTLSVEGVKGTTTYRDTRGPGVANIRAMLESCDRDTEKGRRDYALIRLMFDRGLRRGEVVTLDRVHVDLEARTVAVMAKGRWDRDLLTINPATVEALEAVLADSPDEEAAAPVFVSLHHNGRRARLDGRSVHRIMGDIGVRAGAGRVRPHGLRHSAVTAVLDATNGNVREARAFSRHAKLETVAIYDDARIDTGGELSTKLGEMIGPVGS